MTTANKMILFGDGYPLLFQFMKYIVALFVGMFIFQGIYFYVVLSIFHAEFDEPVTFISLFSVEIISKDKKDGHYNRAIGLIFEILNMFSNFLLIILTSIFWVKQARYKNELDEKSITDSDFAVMFGRLPDNITKKELHDKIKKADVDPSNIVYTNKGYDIKHIVKLKEKKYFWLYKQKYLEAFREKFGKDKNHRQLADLYPKKSILNWPPGVKFPTKEKIEECLSDINIELLKDKNQNVKYCGITIVVMKTQKDAEKLICFYKK